MKVLVDTPVWFYALCAECEGFDLHVEALKRLIMDQRVLMIGAIRQEVLSAYSDLRKFELLKQKLDAFENTAVLDEDYIQAALFANICRLNGIRGSNANFLICAAAIRLKASILTTDKDFERYQQYLPIQRYLP